MNRFVRIAISFCAVCTLSATALCARAQDDYPAGPVKLILGFPPGATTDVVARVLGQKLSTQMNTPVVVETKAGANGDIAADFVAKSKPDGYTLMLNTSSVVFGPALGQKMNYDLLTDLTPISLVAATPYALVVNPALPVNTVPELVSYLKAHPDKVAYSSGGIGNPTHLAMVLFLQANNAQALHVPYNGGGPAIVDLVSDRVQFGMHVQGSVMPMIKDKRLRVLATAALKRSPQLPEVPALSETIPGFEVTAWFGITAPAKLPAAIVKKLNGELIKALQDPQVLAKFSGESAVAIGSSPDEYRAYLKSELDRWTNVVKSNGIKVD